MDPKAKLISKSGSCLMTLVGIHSWWKLELSATLRQDILYVVCCVSNFLEAPEIPHLEDGFYT